MSLIEFIMNKLGSIPTVGAPPEQMTRVQPPKDHAASEVQAWKWEDSDDSVVAYGALLTLLAIGNIPSLKSEQLADLPYFIGLAVITVYIGDYRACI